MAKKSGAGYRITYRDVAEDKFVVVKARRIAESSLGPAFVRASISRYCSGGFRLCKILPSSLTVGTPTSQSLRTSLRIFPALGCPSG